MGKIYTKLYDFLEIGDDYPTIIMGVLNLSPESFYKGSIYDKLEDLETSAENMVANGAQILDLGARSTAPWSIKITINEEIERIVPAMECVCRLIPDDIIISVDTQHNEVAQTALEIALKLKKKIIINDVSCLKTDPSLLTFIIENDLPVILMASKNIPGDLLTIDEINNEFKKTINKLKEKGYNLDKIILDPGIGRWVENKTHLYDLKIIGNLEKLRVFEKPILVALSRKSFIAGTLAATAIAVFNGAHIVRTHDCNEQLHEIIKMAKELRKNR